MELPETKVTKASILVVDDIPESLQYLEQLLEQEGYEVRLIPDGALALMAVQSNLPDLILLDIMMPEIDGYEVCRSLKHDNKTKNIPVIFISALNEPLDKLKAFSVGGVDYIIKPFNKEEVLARISAQLSIHYLQLELEEANRLLEQRVSERTAELTRTLEEKMKMERCLQQSQKMEAIGTLAGGIAHDFNNILFSIQGYTELLLGRLEQNDILHEWGCNIFEGLERAQALVDQILAFSRQSQVKMYPVEVQLIVTEALKFIRSVLPATIEVQVQIDKASGLALADPTQIHQVIMNLITNAFQAMAQTGGKLTVELNAITIEVEETGTPKLRPGDYIRLTVSDTGPGIPAEHLERIFDPYFTTKEKGTGLGLAVTYGIVAYYEGAIRVDSKVGQGSRFQVFLPKLPEQARELKTARTATPIVRGSGSILIVDDDHATLQIEQALLEDLGYQVTARMSSPDALAAFRVNPYQYDLVITDHIMPNMTGIGLAEKMMALRPDIPIILCTGFSEQAHENAAKAIGIKDYLKKPILKHHLASVIRRILDGIPKNQPDGTG